MNLKEEDRKTGLAVVEVEDVIEKRIEEIVTLLANNNGGRSNLYEKILSIVDRSLIKIAMKRSNNVKTLAAAFLGINRNTLHSKINRLDHMDS